MEKKDLVDLTKAINSQTLIIKDVNRRYDLISRIISENTTQLKNLKDNIKILSDVLSKKVNNGESGV